MNRVRMDGRHFAIVQALALHRENTGLSVAASSARDRLAPP